mgnify:CR=1 FL=1
MSHWVQVTAGRTSRGLCPVRPSDPSSVTSPNDVDYTLQLLARSALYSSHDVNAIHDSNLLLLRVVLRLIEVYEYEVHSW